MEVNLDAARAFVVTHARTLDRRRFDLLVDGGDPAGVLAALDAYRNPDGGYGWGLEPDLRVKESQTGAAHHAFEVFAEVAPVTSPHAVGLCQWLASVASPQGGVPFALPVTNAAGVAPWWLGTDAGEPAAQITSVAAAHAHDVAKHDPAVAEHPWLAAATEYCADAMRRLEDPHAFELLFGLMLLDAVGDKIPDASDILERLDRYLPEDGVVHVTGGTENEYLRPLDFAPAPNSAARDLLDASVIDADLRRLVEEQQPDGGWPWAARTFSPASALEWRSYQTVAAISILRKNGVLSN